MTRGFSAQSRGGVGPDGAHVAPAQLGVDAFVRPSLLAELLCQGFLETRLRQRAAEAGGQLRKALLEVKQEAVLAVELAVRDLACAPAVRLDQPSRGDRLDAVGLAEADLAAGANAGARGDEAIDGVEDVGGGAGSIDEPDLCEVGGEFGERLGGTGDRVGARECVCGLRASAQAL